MCCCGKPNINGQPGYSWDGKAVGVRPVDPPEIEERESLIFDEPGRCGGQDSHCHHYRVTSLGLLVRHGGGTERLRLSNQKAVITALSALDSTGRYWLLNALYRAAGDASRNAQDETSAKYRKAFVEGTLKKRKLPAQGQVKVWIEPTIVERGAA